VSAGVLLVNPRVCAPSSTRFPLSLLHLGAALEGQRPWQIVDGNLDPAAVDSALAALAERPHALAAVSVMPGPQVASAIAISSAIRRRFPRLPIAWGGYFATLYPAAAINAPYVDYVVRGQGEATLSDLLARLPDGPSALADVAGLTFKRGGEVVHNPSRPVVHPDTLPPLPFDRLPDVGTYLRPSFMGSRTAAYQLALGCRYKCEFCGVVSMWNGKTALGAPERMRRDLLMLRDRWGANGIQFYDNNFFDKEETSLPVLEALEALGMPWWCFARPDALARFSASTWEKLRRSGLRMTYVGAEAASDEELRRMRKGTRVEQTVEVARRCKESGIIPELSFVLGGPEDPEGQIEATFAFIRRIKGLNPAAEIILYFYSPTPQRLRPSARAASPTPHLPVLASYGPSGPSLPTTPEEWTEPRWVRWVCHEDAPWLTDRIRQRVRDFARVLACRFPTAQDYRTPGWGKAVLQNLARWRYATERYGRPWELRVAQKLVRLREPQRQSL
jgi:hypothetical protein